MDKEEKKVITFILKWGKAIGSIITIATLIVSVSVKYYNIPKELDVASSTLNKHAALLNELFKNEAINTQAISNLRVEIDGIKDQNQKFNQTISDLDKNIVELNTSIKYLSQDIADIRNSINRTKN